MNVKSFLPFDRHRRATVLTVAIMLGLILFGNIVYRAVLYVKYGMPEGEFVCLMEKEHLFNEDLAVFYGAEQ